MSSDNPYSRPRRLDDPVFNPEEYLAHVKRTLDGDRSRTPEELSDEDQRAIEMGLDPRKVGQVTRTVTQSALDFAGELNPHISLRDARKLVEDSYRSE